MCIVLYDTIDGTMTVPVDSLVHRFEWDSDLEVLVKKVLVEG